eukprot:7378360-Prymnesium_polylepis.1
MVPWRPACIPDGFTGWIFFSPGAARRVGEGRASPCNNARFPLGRGCTGCRRPEHPQHAAL